VVPPVDRYKNRLYVLHILTSTCIYYEGVTRATPPVIGGPWLAEYRVIIRRRRIDYSREFIDERVNSSTRCYRIDEKYDPLPIIVGLR